MTLITTVVSHRTVEIQTDPLAPPLIVTRTALIAASRAVQSIQHSVVRPHSTKVSTPRARNSRCNSVPTKAL